MFADKDGPFRVRFRANDNGPSDREQIVNPARDGYAGIVLSVRNDPEVSGRQKTLQFRFRDTLDQRDVVQGRGRMALLQFRPADAFAGKQKVDVGLVFQYSRGLEDGFGIVGKTRST